MKGALSGPFHPGGTNCICMITGLGYRRKTAGISVKHFRGFLTKLTAVGTATTVVIDSGGRGIPRKLLKSASDKFGMSFQPLKPSYLQGRKEGSVFRRGPATKQPVPYYTCVKCILHYASIDPGSTISPFGAGRSELSALSQPMRRCRR